MGIRISPIKLPVDGIAGLALVGAVGRSDHQLFSATITELRREGLTAFVLDLSGLNSISNNLAAEIVALKSDLAERPGDLEVFGANVVVRWFLQQHQGDLRLDPHESLADALKAVSCAAPAVETRSGRPGTPGVETTALPSAETPPQSAPASRDGRPDRFSHATLQQILVQSEDLPTLLCGLQKILRRSALASACRLAYREGDDLIVVGRPGARLQANGWLGSLLLGAASPMSRQEIGDDGFEESEQAYLDWSAADIHIPLIANSELVGILSLDSGRNSGLAGYRSGEVLAFSMLADRICWRILADTGSVELDDDPEAELSPEEIDLLFDSPELQLL